MQLDVFFSEDNTIARSTHISEHGQKTYIVILKIDYLQKKTTVCTEILTYFEDREA